MEGTAQIQQIGSTFINFLMIPAAFVAVIYFIKLVDGLIKEPSAFQIESLIGFLLSFVLAYYSFTAQNKTSILVKNLKISHDFNYSIKVSNLQNKTLKVNAFLYLDGKEIPFAKTIAAAKSIT